MTEFAPDRIPRTRPGPTFWYVHDSAYCHRTLAEFMGLNAEGRARSLAKELNEEHEETLRDPSYTPNLGATVEAWTTMKSSGAHKRRKGLRGEQEVRRAFLDAGYEVRGLEGLGDQHVHGHPFGDLHVEAKRQETILIVKWMEQSIAEAESGSVPIVAFRRNGEPWFICLLLDDFLRAGRPK